MTPRLSILVGAPGAEHEYELTVAWGRPPAKDSVVAIRSVAVDVTALESEKLIFRPLLTAVKMAIGQDDVAVPETVPGDQFDILVAKGLELGR